jgi:hypothetical protein
MRKTTWLALAALFAVPAAVAAQNNSQQSAPAQSSQSSQASQSKSTTQQDPLAEAARKARERQKSAPKTVVVFDNDNLPTAGGISTVGETSAPKSAKSGTTAEANPQGNKAADEWRAKFAQLRKKLAQDQEELSVMQRELSQEMVQYYGGDPQKAYQDQQSGTPFGQKYDQTKAAITAKQKQVDADQQAISDAEDALRKAGGDPGWER